MKRVEFTVYGDPQQQGSMRGFVRNGKVAMTSTNKNLNAWRALVRQQAQDASEVLLDGPVAIEATFMLPRPKSRPKWQIWPTSAPDLDKLIRAIGDALTGVVLVDDAQVVNWACTKTWTEANEKPGVRVAVQELENDRRRTA